MTTIISRSSKRVHRESGVSRDLSLQASRESWEPVGLRPSQTSRAQRPHGHTVGIRNNPGRATSYKREPRGGVLTAPDWSGTSTALPTVTRTKVTPKPSTSRRLIGSRLGSQQQVSERGRRLSVHKNEFSKFSFFVISFLVFSVVMAVMLSGMVTQKTFDITELARKEATLTNEVETLHRDVQQLQSTAGIVERAGDMGMVVPAQPGVLSVGPDGTALQQLEPTTDSRPIIDVNTLPSGVAAPESGNRGSRAQNSVPASSDSQLAADGRRPAEESPSPAVGDGDATSQIRAERDVSRNRMNAVPYQNNT